MILGLQVHIRGHIFYIVLFRENFKGIFLSETNMSYSLGIRYAKSLCGSLLGMAVLEISNCPLALYVLNLMGAI